MNNAARVFVLSTVLGLLAASCGGGPFAATPTKDPIAGTFVLRGGGGAIDAVKALTSAFSAQHPSVVWQGFEDVSSDSSVQLTARGDQDLGFISRDLKPAEKGTVEAVSVGFSGTGVAVNSTNPVKALTKDQVAKIFSGQITDWKDVGGTPGKIRVLVREPGAATRTVFESYFFGSAKPAYTKDAIEVLEIDETVKAITSFKEAIGMMSMVSKTFGTSTIRMLTIDGIDATRENLRNGTYPIKRPLYIVYNADPKKVKPAIKAFIDWIKGPDGQKVLASI